MFKQLAAAAIAVGAAGRITRFITQDDLGEWWIKEPLRNKAAQLDPRWDKYVEGLECPYCVSFWASAAVIGAGAALRWGKAWQVGAGVWAASYLVGHLSAHIDSPDDDDDSPMKLSGLPVTGIEMHFGDTTDNED